jgi:predicted dehydrogenase
MIRIGMLSLAHMHAFSYADCLKNLGEAEIDGIYDDNESRGKKAAKQFKTRYFKDYNKLLERDIDGVVIGSENSRHKELTVASAKAKKHVLCEKPIASTIEDAREMIEVCKENKVKLQICFPCRYSSVSIRLKQMLEEDKIGRILAVKGTNHGMMPGGWFIKKKKSGGGAVIDHTVHVVDLIRWMLKKEIKRVYAEIDTRFYDMDIDDCGMVTMDLEDGIFATLDPSWSRPNKSYPFWGDVTMKFVGTEGTISVDLFGQKMNLYNNDEIKAAWVYWGDNIDIGLINSFINSVINNKSSPVPGEDGLRALEVALAAYESSKLKKPVEI